MKLTLDEFESLDFMGLAAVSIKSALKYRRNWNKESVPVKMLQAMMPTIPGMKKGYRLYLEVGSQKVHYTIPPSVRSAVAKEGYVITDYLAKKCVKKSDAEQKNQYNIGKVIAKYPNAKMAFDNDPVLQNSKSNAISIVISCHPYDIIGMSTGRDWDKESCMRLDDGISNKGDAGAYSNHVANDVAEGTLVAYAVRGDDTNIQTPLCRCLIKPFKNKNGDIFYRRESDLYGNHVPGFMGRLNSFLREFNADAPNGTYSLSDDLYNDGVGSTFSNVKSATSNLIQFDDVRDDYSLVNEYVQQQLKVGRAENRRNIISILLRNRDIDLKQTAIDEVVETINNSKPAFIEEFVQGAIEIGSLSKTGRTIVRQLKHDIDGKGFKPEWLEESTRSLVSLATVGSIKAATELYNRIKTIAPVAKRAAKPVAGRPRPRAGVSDSKNARYFFDGRVPLPPEEVLKSNPDALKEMGCFAQLAKNLPLFGEDKYEDFVYDFEDLNLGTFDAAKTYKEKVFDWAEDMGGSVARSAAVLEYADQYGDVAAKAMNNNTVNSLIARRPWRALIKKTSANARKLIDSVLLHIFRNLMEGVSVNKYRDVMKDVMDFVTANPSVVGDLGSDFPSVMRVSMDIFAAYSVPQKEFKENLPEIVYRMMEAIVNHKGEGGVKIRSNDPNVQMCLSIFKYVESLTYNSENISRHIDAPDVTLAEINAWLKKYKAMVGTRLKQRPMTILEIVKEMADYGWEFNLLQVPELAFIDLPFSLSRAFPKDVFENADKIFEHISKMTDRGDVIDAFSSIAESIYVEPAAAAPDRRWKNKVKRMNLEVGTTPYQRHLSDFIAETKEDVATAENALPIFRKMDGIIGNLKTRFKDNMSISSKTVSELLSRSVLRLRKMLKNGIDGAEEVITTYTPFLAENAK